MFSAIYAGIRSVKWPHLGVVGNIFGKEMGKDLPRAVGLSVMHWAPAISICNTANGRVGASSWRISPYANNSPC